MKDVIPLSAKLRHGDILEVSLQGRIYPAEAIEFVKMQNEVEKREIVIRSLGNWSYSADSIDKDSSASVTIIKRATDNT